MLRVGFVFSGGDGWIGGVNYFWNLFYAIGRHEQSAITPVLLAAPGANLHGLDALDGVEVQQLDHVPATDALGAITRIVKRRVGGTDEMFARVAREARLDVISHSDTFGWRFPIPTTPWRADFQHRRLPQNFTSTDLAMRAYVDVHQLIEGTRMIVSSEAAQADCRRFYGPLARRTEVLRFVSQPRVDLAVLPSVEALRAKHGIPAPYFFLPNQFWRHKNHAVVVDALARLRREDVRPIVVLTGKGEDYRAPGHYEALMGRVTRAGLCDQFLHLGMVPFAELAALMRGALAVINPSCFEGWSTTVEEARSMGKVTLLSDIEVHREQAPDGARYFAPDDSEGLAALLADLWRAGPTDEDAVRERAAAATLPARTAAFAARYRAIVEAALQG